AGTKHVRIPLGLRNYLITRQKALEGPWRASYGVLRGYSESLSEAQPQVIWGLLRRTYWLSFSQKTPFPNSLSLAAPDFLGDVELHFRARIRDGDLEGRAVRGSILPGDGLPAARGVRFRRTIGERRAVAGDEP